MLFGYGFCKLGYDFFTHIYLTPRLNGPSEFNRAPIAGSTLRSDPVYDGISASLQQAENTGNAE